MKANKKNAATKIVKRLQNKGFEAYFAGGCVRDMVLSREPKDFDIATSAKPSQVKDLFKRTISIGEKYGTIIVIEAGQSFEVTTFRVESGYSDNRRPDNVEFTSAEEDAKRRDFTMNAMFFDPVKKKLIDFVDGKSDVKKNVIRFVGDPRERIEEDHLRLLRAIRFKITLGFQYAPETFDVIRSNSSLIGSVAAERVRDELNLIFSSSNKHIGLVELSESGICNIVLPEIEALKGVPQPYEYHHEGDVFTHTYLALKSLKKDEAGYLCWATLLHDISKPQTLIREGGRIIFHDHAQKSAEIAKDILKRLKFPNFEIETIVWLVDNHMRIGDIEKMRPYKRMGFLLDHRFPSLIELARADCLGTYPINTTLVNMMELDREKALEAHESARIVESSGNILKGDDLIAVGFEEGENFGTYLEEANDMIADNTMNKEEALNYLVNKYRQ
jgi:poly(A) polymerase